MTSFRLAQVELLPDKWARDVPPRGEPNEGRVRQRATAPARRLGASDERRRVDARRNATMPLLSSDESSGAPQDLTVHCVASDPTPTRPGAPLLAAAASSGFVVRRRAMVSPKNSRGRRCSNDLSSGAGRGPPGVVTPFAADLRDLGQRNWVLAGQTLQLGLAPSPAEPGRRRPRRFRGARDRAVKAQGTLRSAARARPARARSTSASSRRRDGPRSLRRRGASRKS